MTPEKNILNDALLIFCSKVEDGNMSYKYGEQEQVKKNREAFYKKVNIEEDNFFPLRTPNKDVICHIKEMPTTEYIDADAVITTLPNFYIANAFGDCGPFVLYDTKKNILGFAHLGWRSTYFDLHSKMVRSFIEEYGSSAADIIAFIGPSIQQESYGLEEAAQLENPAWPPYIEKKNNLYYLDLQGYIVDGIKKEGILLENINKSEEDTAKDFHYFSHYRSLRSKDPEGRFLYGAGLLK
ncbi:MAG: polyphenol oxidase family protein [Bacilli bacterium]|nr:polyphenol oxidase family protein [Bacilli bacterium]